MKNIIKRILAFFLVVYLVIVPPVAYANSPGGWGFTKYNIITGVLTAVKDGLTVSARAAPSASTVGKYALRGAGAVAIAYAVAKYGGQAIDWVIDEGTQTLKYKPSIGTFSINKTITPPQGKSGLISVVGASAIEVCSKAAAAHDVMWSGIRHSVSFKVSANNCLLVTADNKSPDYDVALTLPITTLPEKNVPVADVVPDIIEGAKKGDSAAQNLVNQAVADDVNTGVYDTALNDAESHSCGNGTYWNGSACVITDKPVDVPAFDPSSIISAINSLGSIIDATLHNLLTAIQSIPDVINAAIDKVLEKIDAKITELTDFITDTYTDFKDTATSWKDAFVSEYKDVKDKVTHYFTDEPVMTDTPLPESNPTLKDPSEFDKDYIKVTAQCPDDVERQIPVGNMSFTLRFPMSPLCDFLSTYARPVIILMAYITAALSIGNAFRVGG